MTGRTWDDDPDLRAEAEAERQRHRAQPNTPSSLEEWDAGDDTDPIPPRGWLLGNTICRRFVSSIIADGGVGKTALRIAQCLSLATGRPLTGEHVFQRCRVLLISLEDDRDELRRRVRAAMLHFGISPEEVKGWLFLSAPGRKAGKLAITENGTHKVAGLADEIEAVIRRRNIDFICIDPLVKAHGVEENSNDAMDFVTGILAQIAIDNDCAVDVPHHVSKGSSDPGNANRGRGAVAVKDAARLNYTLTVMSTDDAELFGIKTPEERRVLIRMDSGKVNICPPGKAKWFKLIGVPLGNGTDLYPNGDEVQVATAWLPPDMWDGISMQAANAILDQIDAGFDGRRYSSAPQAKDRAAWGVVRQMVPSRNEKQCRAVIKTWVENGLLDSLPYHDPIERRDVAGLYVNPAAPRPGTSF